MQWERLRESCREHMLKDNVRGLETLIGFVYLKTGTDSREENAQHWTCIYKDVVGIGTNWEMVSLGDMNAHLEDFDGYTDSTGKMLQEFCDALDLVLVDAEIKCDGKIIWERNNLHSTIDYCLMSCKLYNR